MDILFLGNGFDLYHDLPTAYINYIHVINSYLEIYDDQPPSNLELLLNSPSLLNSDWRVKNAFEKYKRIYAKFFITQDEHNRIKALKDNYWFKYFSKCCPDDLTWIDFEKEIQSVIDAFELLFNNLRTVNKDNLSFVLTDSKSINYKLLNFNYYFDESDEQSQSYIGLVEYRFKNEFIKQEPEGSGLFVYNKKKIIDSLYQQLEEFSDGLKLYLTLFVDYLISDEQFSNLVEKGTLFNHHFERVITFNYTKTFEKVYAEDGGISCIHVHGYLDDKIVLGVNSNESDEGIIDTTFLIFKKYYQRIINKTDIGYINLKNHIINKKINPVLSDTSIKLTVFGHSLDKTDEDIIKDMFALSDKIYIYYYNNTLKSIVKNLISIYGKDAFDRIRYEKNIDFLPIE